MENQTIIMNREDVNNPLHPHLWESWLDTLGVDAEATEVCLQLSPLDDNKKMSPKKEALSLLNRADNILTEMMQNRTMDDESCCEENIFCPLGEVMSNVEELE